MFLSYYLRIFVPCDSRFWPCRALHRLLRETAAAGRVIWLEQAVGSACSRHRLAVWAVRQLYNLTSQIGDLDALLGAQTVFLQIRDYIGLS